MRNNFTTETYVDGVLVSKEEKFLNAADIEYAMAGGFRAKTQGEHIAALNTALINCANKKICAYENRENGDCGSLHIYTFQKKDAPTFATNSDDIFNQNIIKVL